MILKPKVQGPRSKVRTHCGRNEWRGVSDEGRSCPRRSFGSLPVLMNTAPQFNKVVPRSEVRPPSPVPRYFRFLLSSFCVLLLNAAAAQSNLVGLTALLKASTNALLATPAAPSAVITNLAPKVTTNVATNLATNLATKAATNVAINLAANLATKVYTNVAINLATNLAPKITTNVATNLAANLAPKVVPNLATKVTTNLTPKVATNIANSTNFVASSMDALDDKHKLASGDRLSYRVIEDQIDTKEPLEPKVLFVADTGDLEIPFLGRFPAVGKNCKQLAHEIKAALEKDYYYQATVVIAVELRAKRSGAVYVVGQVRLTGPVDMPGDEQLTLSKAVLRAGGFTDYADKRHVKVTRKVDADAGASKTFTVDLNEVLEEGKTDKDLLLEPGDTIFVASRLFKF